MQTTAFTALRWAGGAYLLWLGVQAWRHAGQGGQATAQGAETGLGRLFAKGLLANAINPKVVLFFLSLLPQFVHPAQGPVALQMTVLGSLFALQAGLLFGLLGWFSGHIGQWLQRRPRAGFWLDRLAATVFVGLGLRMIAVR